MAEREAKRFSSGWPRGWRWGGGGGGCSVGEKTNEKSIYTPSFGCSRLGSPQRIIIFQFILSSPTSSVTLTYCMSSLTTPLNFLFGLPPFLLLGNSILNILLRNVLHVTTQNMVKPPTSCLPYFSLVVLNPVTSRHSNLNILSSAGSSSVSCLLGNRTVSVHIELPASPLSYAFSLSL